MTGAGLFRLGAKDIEKTPGSGPERRGRELSAGPSANALHHAALVGDDHRVETLLAFGVEADARLQSEEERGRTPLHSAVIAAGDRLWRAADLRIFRQLLEAKADPNARDDLGRTPLMHLALVGADWRLVDLLLEAGADPTLLDWKGFDAHAYAVSRGQPRIAALLRGSTVERRLSPHRLRATERALA